MSYFGKTATVRFVKLAYSDFSYIFPIETTNEPFGLKNINKPVQALGPYGQCVKFTVIRQRVIVMETTEIQLNISISDIYEWLQVRVLIHSSITIGAYS